MKKYKITFTTSSLDYTKWINIIEWEIPFHKKNLEVYKKWKGKEITILELEENIKEFDRVVFDGNVIEIYNDYRE